ncbi:MAG TPA: hypothetical protein VG733_09675, partial [Chthoniobacteraceae bacterium]|nr:hypothetical protein [Chthoniobacteraceae bacterium]
LLAARGGAMELEQRAEGPAPYKHHATKVSVRLLEDGMVSICVEKEAGEIMIEGGEEALELFARNVESFGKYSPPGQHWHVEYFEGHACLAPGSFPCVMMMG